jgi:hypothetical protein
MLRPSSICQKKITIIPVNIKEAPMKAFALFTCGFCLALFSARSYAQWPAPVLLINETYNHSEASVASCPGSPNLMLCGWNDMPSGPDQPRAGFSFSTDAGRHWLGHNVILTSGAQWPYDFDPSVAFDLQGIAYYCHATENARELGPVVVSRTSNLGAIWEHSVVQNEVSGDKPYMAIDNYLGSPNVGNIYVSWTDFTYGNAIKIAYSTDGGNQWIPSNTIDESGSFFDDINLVSTSPTSDRSTKIDLALVHGSMPAVAPNGDVYVTWLRHDSPGQILVCRSTNGGASFLSPVSVSGQIETRFRGPFYGGPRHDVIRPSSMPSIAVDPSSGTIYVAYTEWGTGYDVKCKRSTDHGSSWVVVQNPTDRTEDQQFFPSLAIAPSGTVSLLYYDLTDAGAASITRVKTAQSLNHGISFVTPSAALGSFNHAYFEDVMLGGFDYVSIDASSASDFYATYSGLGQTHNMAVFGTFDARPAQPQNLSWSGQPGQHPTLTWTANQEADLAGYNIYRFDPTIGSNGLWVKLNTSLITTNSYTDNSITLAGGGIPSHYEHYRVHAVDQQQLESVPSEQVEVLATGLPLEKQPTGANSVPPTFAMDHNYPNPFNPSTQIRYDLPDAGFVSLVVYDVLGRKVADLVNENREAGYHSATWNAANVSSGVYFARFTVGNEIGRVVYSKMSKLILMK